MLGSDGWVRDVPQDDSKLSRADLFLDEVFNPILAPVSIILAVLVLLTRG